MSSRNQSVMQVFLHVKEHEERQAREACYTLLKETDPHLLFQVQCYIMLAGFADISPVAEKHFKDANRVCEQLWKSRNEGEEKKILTYGAIIAEGLEDLEPEMKSWKLGERICDSSNG